MLRTDEWGTLSLDSWQTTGALGIRLGWLGSCFKTLEERWCSLNGAMLSWTVSAGVLAPAGSFVVHGARVAPIGLRSVVVRQLTFGSSVATFIVLRASDSMRRNVWLAALRAAAGERAGGRERRGMPFGLFGGRSAFRDVA